VGVCGVWCVCVVCMCVGVCVCVCVCVCVWVCVCVCMCVVCVWVWCVCVRGVKGEDNIKMYLTQGAWKWPHFSSERGRVSVLVYKVKNFVGQ